MPDIFVSYAREDQERVRPIVKELEQRNWSIFWDTKISPGDNWSNYIGQQLSESRCVLVCWSKHSINSKWVKKEAAEGENQDILIPVLLEDVEPPFPFKDIHAADLSRWNNNASYPAFQELIRVIASKCPLPSQRIVTPPHFQSAIAKSVVLKTLFSTKPFQRAGVTVITVIALVLAAFWFTRSESQESSSFQVETASPAITLDLQNFVSIRGGTFTMGSPADEAEKQSDEKPQHQVRLSDFYMGKYEVTVAEFRKFIEESGYRTEAEKANESRTWRHGVSGSVRPASEDNHPVVYVSWNDAVEYCKWLSFKTGKKFRLPTEAELEYACRGGSTTITPFNTGYNLTTLQANYDGNYPYNNNQKGHYKENTVPVNSFAPNAWGLYNMHGNVWEWCRDWYDSNYYASCKSKGVVTNPENTATGSLRVIRGGGWSDDAGSCRSADRDRSAPDYRNDGVGFRLVFVP